MTSFWKLFLSMLLVVAFSASGPASAADTTSNASATAAAISGASSGDTVQTGTLAKGPKFIPAEAPKNDPNDRVKSTAQAKAQALMGQQKSQATCNLLKQQAMKAMQEEKSTDAMLMLALSKQSCDQADEMKKSADENDKGMKLISKDDIGKQASLEFENIDLNAGTKVAEADLSAFRAMVDDAAQAPTSAGSGTDPNTGTADLSALIKAAQADQVVSTKQMAEAADPEVAAAGPKGPSPSTALSTIAAPTSNLNSNGNDNGAGGALGSGVTGIGLAGAGQPGAAAAAAADGTKTASLGAAGGGGRDRSSRLGGGQPAGYGAAGGGGGEEKKQDPLEAMLSQLMGGGASEGESVLPSDGSGILTSLGKEPGAKAMNVFEYASLRYSKLGKAERVSAKRLASEAPAAAPGVAEANVAAEGHQAPNRTIASSREPRKTAP